MISALRDWVCSTCGGTGELLIMENDEPACMECADMDHLVFLPSGDAALTRRAKRASRLSAVVVRFSRARKRYERQGILVEADALERAEAECLADAPAGANVTSPGAKARTSSYRLRWPRQSQACIPDAPGSGHMRSHDTPRRVAADVSDDQQPAATSNNMRSS